MPNRLEREYKEAVKDYFEKCYGIGECGHPQKARHQIKKANKRAGRLRRLKAKMTPLED